MTAPPECPTCHPRWAPSPSGGTWFHRRPCSDGAQIGGYQRARANHPAQGTRRHPEGRSRLQRLALNDTWVKTWRSHEPGCSCLACVYVEAHLDRDDDERGGMAS